MPDVPVNFQNATVLGDYMANFYILNANIIIFLHPNAAKSMNDDGGGRRRNGGAAAAAPRMGGSFGAGRDLG